MIENPWVILMIDRRKLGGTIYAVARGDRRDGTPRRTLRVGKALRFPTRRKAENRARKLTAAHANRRIFAVAEVLERDLPRPRPDTVHRQTAFAEVT